MENDGKIMTSQESLRIITDMINKTKTDINQSSFHLLFWGWLIFFCSISEYLLVTFTSFESPWYVWYAVIPGVVFSIVYGFIKGRRETVFTYATGVYISTWVAFLFSAVVMGVVLNKSMDSFASFILLLAAVPTFVSGFILKFKPLIFGAVTFWLFSLAAHFGGEHLSALAVPVSMLTGYLIPGYLLKRKMKNDTV